MNRIKEILNGLYILIVIVAGFKSKYAYFVFGVDAVMNKSVIIT